MADTETSPLFRWTLVVAFACAALVAIMLARGQLSRPQTVLLLHDGASKWIRYDRPLAYSFQEAGVNTRWFRTEFSVSDSDGPHILTLRAHRHANVYIDDQLVFEDSTQAEAWKDVRTVRLPDTLAQGAHELVIEAREDTGPVLVLARCDSLGIRTDEHWEASVDREEWIPAVSADKRYASEEGRNFLRSDRALIALAPYLIPLFILVVAGRGLVLSDRLPETARAFLPTANAVRWTMLAAWTVMAVHNFAVVPKDRWVFGYEWRFGFDIRGHMEYINFLIDERRIPEPGEGWKLNEAPLYYMLIAAPYAFLREAVPFHDAVHYLRVVALLCGLAQIELTFRVLRHLFPDHPARQAMGTVFAACLPMNLYLSQYMNPLTFAGMLSSLAIVLGFRYLRDEKIRGAMVPALLIGVVYGLSLLTKVTAVPLLPPLLLLLAYAARPTGKAGERELLQMAKPIAAVLGAAFVVCGWYFGRNLLQVGTPFSVGSESVLGYRWFQDPGFHTVSDFTRFGESLWFPVHSQMMSFWDSLYSTFWVDGFLSSFFPPHHPPWNYTPMLAGSMLALIPMALIAIGGASSVLRGRAALSDGTFFALLYVLTMIAAMIWLYLSTPAYSAGKAVYLINVVTAIAALAAAGYGVVSRVKWADAIVCGAMACWAATAYAAYWMNAPGVTMIQP